MPAEIELYTAATMNGWKPLIFLEEAKVDYELHPIEFSKREQKSDWFLKINPNGRIPAIVNRGRGDFAVFESGAILWCLAERFGQFLPSEPQARSVCMQWMYFQVGGVGPMMGQAMFFQRIAAPHGHDIPFAVDRYVKESRRLLEVLDARLGNEEYLAGPEYTIADMMNYPWARSYPWAKVGIEGLENLQRWFSALDARPAVAKAITIPRAVPSFFWTGDVDKEVRENAERFRHEVKG